jgi:hypothetical protein
MHYLPFLNLHNGMPTLEVVFQSRDLPRPHRHHQATFPMQEPSIVEDNDLESATAWYFGTVSRQFPSLFPSLFRHQSREMMKW